MRKPLLIAFLIISCFGKAQITITSTNAPSSGDTTRLSMASTTQLTSSLVTDYKLTGASYFWNFDSLKPIGQVMRKFEPAMAYSYFSTGFCEKTADTMDLFIAQFTNVCDIFKKTSSSFNMDAWGITFSGFPIPNSYSDKDEIYNFPLKYLDRDSTTFAMSTITSSLIPFGFKKHGYRITEADGWGYIKTPYGTEPCLRVVTTQYATDSIRASIPIDSVTTIPINIGYPNYVKKYQWLTHGEKVPYLEVSGTVLANNFVPNQVRYRDRIRYFAGINEVVTDKLALSIYPNPASTDLNFIIPSTGTYVVEINDMQGRNILSNKFDNENSINKNTINISELAPGIYSGRINSGRVVQNFKFIKQ